MTDYDFDVAVIGSGFGGSVMTCRLAEKGYRVCLLERGRQYGMHEFPRRMEEVRDQALWDPRDGKLGLIEFRDYPQSDVISVSASGLGGGSLIYANVLMRMPADFFAGWPGGITRQALDPCYDRVLEMLEASPYPHDSDPYYAETPKTDALKQAAARLERSPDALEPPRFVYPHLAVRFEGDFPGHQSRNKQGVVQSSCIKCGECDVGCNILAKNTLDLTYLAKARKAENLGAGGVPAEIRTGALVDTIRPLEGAGYEVRYARPGSSSADDRIRARKVVLSAGSVGSTALLLKMKQQGILGHLSPMLGKSWCGNGDLEGTVLFGKDQMLPTMGPVITGALQVRCRAYPDGFPHGFVIQDAGIPWFLAWYLAGRLPSPGATASALWLGVRFLVDGVKRALGLGRRGREINLGDDLSAAIDDDEFIRRAFVLLGMGRDRSTGRIELRADGEPIIKWSLDDSSLHYDRVRREMKQLAEAMGGKFLENPLTLLDKIVAVHPLGGCVMADAPEKGVVSSRGEVFGHPGLYVVDASVIPTSIGPNPSLTIAAVAEYMAERFEL